MEGNSLKSRADRLFDILKHQRRSLEIEYELDVEYIELLEHEYDSLKYTTRRIREPKAKTTPHPKIQPSSKPSTTKNVPTDIKNILSSMKKHTNRYNTNTERHNTICDSEMDASHIDISTSITYNTLSNNNKIISDVYDTSSSSNIIHDIKNRMIKSRLSHRDNNNIVIHDRHSTMNDDVQHNATTNKKQYNNDIHKDRTSIKLMYNKDSIRSSRVHPHTDSSNVDSSKRHKHLIDNINSHISHANRRLQAETDLNNTILSDILSTPHHYHETSKTGPCVRDLPQSQSPPPRPDAEMDRSKNTLNNTTHDTNSNNKRAEDQSAVDLNYTPSKSTLDSRLSYIKCSRFGSRGTDSRLQGAVSKENDRGANINGGKSQIETIEEKDEGRKKRVEVEARRHSTINPQTSVLMKRRRVSQQEEPSSYRDSKCRISSIYKV